MRDGFIKVAAVTPKVVVADPVENTIRIKAAVMEAAANGAKVIVCPELTLPDIPVAIYFYRRLY